MSDTGVVDPIRVPPWLREPIERAWREAPPAARLFAGLALVDVLSRGTGLLQPRLDVGLDLFAVIGMLIPHDLWILLPAVLVLRRPDAARVTPLVFWGSVVVALVTLLERPLESWLAGPFGTGAMSIEVGVLSRFALGVGWILVARGLADLGPRRPSPGIAGFSNIVLFLGALGLIVGAGRDLVYGGQTGDPSLDGLLALSNLVFYAQLGGWLYLLWIVIRAFEDPRRPAIATAAGAVGASLSGLLGATGIVLTALMLLAQGPIQLGGGANVQGLSFAFGALDLWVGQALLVAAFALGLAEPPIPYVAPPEAALPAEPGETSAETSAGDPPAEGAGAPSAG